MKAEAVVTIAVRLMGLALTLYILRPAATAASDLAVRFPGTTWSGASTISLLRLAPLAATALLLGLGLYMFLSGRWFIRRITRGLGPEAEGVCPGCGYDLAGLRVSRCPECGQRLPKDVAAAAARSKPGS